MSAARSTSTQEEHGLVLGGARLQTASDQEWQFAEYWLVSVSLKEVPNGVVVAGLGLRSLSDPPQQITAAVWRSIPVGAVIDAATERFRDLMELQNQVYDDMDREWAEAWQHRGGREGHPDELYARLAQLYCGLRATGVRNPVEEVAKSMRVASRATASQRLQTARSRGLLDGAELTKKAKKLLGVPASERGF